MSTKQSNTKPDKQSPIINYGYTQGSSQRKPIKAVIPIQALNRTSPLRLKNRISPDAEVLPRLDLSPVIVGKSYAWLVGTNRTSDQSSCIRRTASLDAIFLKGSKHTDPGFSLLLLNKATQTPEEWVPCCLTEVTSGVVGCSVGSSNGSCPNSGSSENSSGTNSRRASGSTSSPWPKGSVSTTEHGENLEQFIRQRLQRTNRGATGVTGSRHSPIPADHSILVRPYACVQTNLSSASEGTVRSASVPQLPQSLLPRFRSSVEDLNQEIERLVLQPHSYHGSEEEEEELSCLHEDGRRAPVPDYFRCKRSVNTQTPARYSSCTSGNGSDQSVSPALSPPPGQISTPPNSPPGSLRLSSMASPHINKFLTKEPPDGCERVSLKVSEEKCGLISTSLPSTKPTTVFTLLPSLGSAFYAPGRTVSNQGKSTHKHETEGDEGAKSQVTQVESVQKTSESETDNVLNVSAAEQ